MSAGLRIARPKKASAEAKQSGEGQGDYTSLGEPIRAPRRPNTLYSLVAERSIIL
jgi:hypothetical protein